MLGLDTLVGDGQGTSKQNCSESCKGEAGAPVGQEHKRETQSKLFTEVRIRERFTSLIVNFLLIKFVILKYLLHLEPTTLRSRVARSTD